MSINGYLMAGRINFIAAIFRVKASISTTKCEEDPKTELLNRYETVCLYKQTFIHTSNIIE